jgi:hypothetical protein
MMRRNNVLAVAGAFGAAVLVLVVALLLDEDDVKPATAKTNVAAADSLDSSLVASAARYDDGRQNPDVGAVNDFHAAPRPVRDVYEAVRVTPVGWWERGPVRRTVSYPIRYLASLCE